MITLATLEQATEQEVFDQVKNHLLRQNKKCTKIINESSFCAYRNENGDKCAAGCFISDDEYNNFIKNEINIESKGWKQLVSVEITPVKHSDLIYRLQNIHDGYQPESWPDRLNELAQQLNLKY